MTIHVNIGKAKAQLSRLVAASLRGEEVIIDHAGKPQVRLTPVAEARLADRAVRDRRLDEIIAAMAKVPIRSDAADPLEWDENGLPI